MTDPALIERITRSLAYMLRHQPEAFDLELDAYGYCDLEDVVHALNERLGEPIDEEDVREAVRSGDRPRYAIEGGRIRALYGHSIPVEPGPSSKPPEFLFVAIPASELERARRFGLRGGRRRFLHLATSKEDAAESGRRASRSYAILVIHALDAWEEGVSFYDRTALWLAEEIPTHLIEVEGTYDDGVDPVRRHDGPREREREHGRGHERTHSQGQERFHGAPGQGEGRGRRRRRGGRGRDRHHAERPLVGRGTQESEAFRGEPSFERETPSDFAPAVRGEREGRRDFGGSREGGRERPEPGRGREERPGREERRAERRSGSEGPRAQPERTPERVPERPGEPLRRERAPLPSAAPSSGFGAGIDSQEPVREREPRAPTPPRPAPPPPRQDPPQADRPRFGAGL